MTWKPTKHWKNAVALCSSRRHRCNFFCTQKRGRAAVKENYTLLCFYVLSSNNYDPTSIKFPHANLKSNHDATITRESFCHLPQPNITEWRWIIIRLTSTIVRRDCKHHIRSLLTMCTLQSPTLSCSTSPQNTIRRTPAAVLFRISSLQKRMPSHNFRLEEIMKQKQI